MRRSGTLVSVDQLANAIDDPALCLFDCRFDLADTGRGARAFAESRLPGAVYAHLDHDLSSPITAHSGRHPLPDVDALIDWLGRNGVASGSQVVGYDDSGGTMAVRLWWLLRWLGHADVAVLDGGWQAWTDAALPLERGTPTAPTATRFDGVADVNQVVSTAQLEQQLREGSDRLLLMDARTAERFRGEAEPIDPVAGHIPGAINLPLQENLQADGRFKPPATLRDLYRQALAGRSAADVAAMCGSGVTACHNLLAMEIAGMTGGRLYAGSWSEWIRDPHRPVATGER